MKKIIGLTKEIFLREGTPVYFDESKTTILTIGKLIIRSLDFSLERGENARRAVQIANEIEKAMEEGKDEIEFQENSAIDIIKKKVDEFQLSAFIRNQIGEIFDETDREYIHRHDPS